LENEPWYQNTEPGKTNNYLYGRYFLKASDILSTYLPVSEGVIILIDPKKYKICFIANKEDKIWLQSEIPLEKFDIGQIIAVSAEKQQDGKPHRIFSIKRLEEKECDHPLRRIFSGKLRLSERISLGFVEDVLVAYFLHKHLNNGEMVEGIAVPAFDNKKKIWGWKALYLKKLTI